MIRLGLCCKFMDQPIKFRNTTATAALKLSRQEALQKISQLCLANATSLREALGFCAEQGIGDFRINSQILPLKTHPQAGYDITELPAAEDIVSQFQACGAFAKEHDLRLTFHPDQFILLSAQKPDIISRSVAELEYQAQVATWVGADVINIHGGGAYGDKKEALKRLAQNLDLLSDNLRAKLTLENDDRIYTPSDLLLLCKAENIPLVYDLHHHRCLPDGRDVEQTTERALATWNREPLFHISSPIEGWQGSKPFRHHDYINIRDFPKSWMDLDITVEVEAKAKELAVLRLAHDLQEISCSSDRDNIDD